MTRREILSYAAVCALAALAGTLLGSFAGAPGWVQLAVTGAGVAFATAVWPTLDGPGRRTPTPDAAAFALAFGALAGAVIGVIGLWSAAVALLVYATGSYLLRGGGRAA